MKLVWIDTTRHSELFKRIFREYNSGVRIKIGGASYSDGDIELLASEWCTNRNIRNVFHFRLIREGRELFGFDCSPDQMWAAYSELPFVEKLREERIVRYQVLEYMPSKFERLMERAKTWLKGLAPV